MIKTIAVRGVCAACKWDPECEYETQSDGLVLECGQFEMGFRKEAARPPLIRSADRLDAAKPANGFVGLCVNCDHRETCIYPKPEGGVWRCEEYA